MPRIITLDTFHFSKLTIRINEDGTNTVIAEGEVSDQRGAFGVPTAREIALNEKEQAEIDAIVALVRGYMKQAEDAPRDRLARADTEPIEPSRGNEPAE